MSIAFDLAKLGTCDRKQVGALIVRDGRCISWGYNGAPPGAPHCSYNNHGYPREEKVYAEGCLNATHAEANALAFAARQGISTDKATLYVTVSPCPVCSRLLIAAGIRAVGFTEEYRDPTGLDILLNAGILCAAILPSA